MIENYQFYDFHIPNMILIGSAGRNSGKTTLARSILSSIDFSIPVYALKIVTITGDKGVCQRGGTGCGVCTDITADYEIIEENNSHSTKDTSLLLQAGADKSYLLKTLKPNLTSALKDFLNRVPSNAIILCESNSAREVLLPGVFLFIQNTSLDKMKPSAHSVYKLADQIIHQVTEDFTAYIEMNPSNDRMCFSLEADRPEIVSVT